MTAAAFDLLAQPIQRVLWDMRWRELRPIQVAAIHTVLGSDHDALITARTASGKTEAAFLPILSELHTEPAQTVGAIYVGPLKALINDQFRRLDQLCERAEIPVHRWHGDVDASKKSKLLEKPGGVLLITPESLESFFVNRSSRLLQVFADLKFVVIDEIHSLVGRERGLQLRSLLYRLRRFTRSEFRLLGLSATVGDAVESYKSWMRPKAPDRVQHIYDAGEQKRTKFGIHCYNTATDDEGPEDNAEEVPSKMTEDVLRWFCGRKNMMFCNSRQGVEWLADELNESCRQSGRPEEFLVHHGSISKELRFYCEEQMRSDRPATVVCSSSLELGIDIGNVSTVGQVGACWSVSSQVQRMGRSGRRDSEAHCMRVLIPLRPRKADADLVDRLYPELVQATAIAELMRQRWVEPPPTAVHDLSTLVQQVLSALAASGGLNAKEVFGQLITNGAFSTISPADFASVLRSLGRSGLIEQMADGLLLLAPKGERLVHDMEFYSAFTSVQELSVRFQSQEIGSLSAAYLPVPGDNFLLGGRRWQTVSVDAGRAEVHVTPAIARKPPKFLGRAGEIHPRIRQQMKDVLERDVDFEYLDETSREFLALARQTYLESRCGSCPMVDLGGRHSMWFTWTGTRVHRTLLLLAEKAGLNFTDEEIAIRFQAGPAEAAGALVAAAERFTSAELLVAGLPVDGWRKFDEFLSEDLVRQSMCHELVDLDGARKCVAELSSAVSPGELAAGLATWKCRQADHSDLPCNEVEKRFSNSFSDRPLQDCDFIAFDLETTGFHPRWAKIVEIAAIRFRHDGCEKGRFQQLVRPGEKIPPAAISVHGITDDMVAGAPCINEVLPRLTAYLSSDSPLLVAHNAAFDQDFLANAALLHGISLPVLPVVDTLALARAGLPNAPNYRLGTIAEVLGVEASRFHRAEADSETTKEVLLRLIDRMGLQTTQELYSLAGVLPLNESSLLVCEPPAGFEWLSIAIEEGRRVQMTYALGMRGIVLQQCVPVAVTFANGKHYLSAMSTGSKRLRTFRLDRIQQFALLDQAQPLGKQESSNAARIRPSS